MPRDPLAVLLRLRGIALDTARRALAERMAAEADAAARADALRDAVAGETVSQATQPGERWMAEAFATWLGRIRLAQRDAADAVRRGAAATSEARAVVQEARVGVRTLEAMLAEQAAHRRDTAARTEQAALDEAGAARKPGDAKWADG